MTLSAVVASRGDQVWLVRGQGSLFGGLFGVPMAEGEGLEVAESVLAAHALEARLLRDAPARVSHVLTHRVLDVAVYSATNATGSASDQLRPFALAELDEVGVATLTRKILEAAAAPQLGLALTRS